jgi:hypothetical protein
MSWSPPEINLYYRMFKDRTKTGDTCQCQKEASYPLGTKWRKALIRQGLLLIGLAVKPKKLPRQKW